MKKFNRLKEHRWIIGLLGGLAYSLGIPAWIVRLIFVLATYLIGGILPILYFAGLFLIPQWDSDPKDYHDDVD